MKHKYERDIVVYKLAQEYLLSFEPVTEEMLRQYVDSADNPKGINSIADVYQQLVRSAQNANMKASVVGGALGGIERLGPVLCDFDPVKTRAKYGDNSEQLLKDIVTVLKPAGQIRRTPKSIWPQFCKSVLSAAEFLSQFSSVEDFVSWVNHFDKDDRARPALPMLLANEVHGIGFPLACDFLKELGYLDFCKPDVHLKKILPALHLSKSNNDYAIFKAIVRIARSNDTKPYTVDKIFWLIGSGNFYDSEIKIGKHGNDFVDFVKNRTGD
jgi:hypothetical protein